MKKKRITLEDLGGGGGGRKCFQEKKSLSKLWIERMSELINKKECKIKAKKGPGDVDARGEGITFLHTY